MIQEKERESLRALATRWMEHAANPVMPNAAGSGGPSKTSRWKSR